MDDGNPGSPKDPNFTSNSNELVEQFNKKTNEITKTMAGLHFSTIHLRNKLPKGCINKNHPIITQVTVGNVLQGQGQVRVEIYPPTVLLEGDKGIPVQGDETTDKIFFL